MTFSMSEQSIVTPSSLPDFKEDHKVLGFFLLNEGKGRRNRQKREYTSGTVSQWLETWPCIGCKLCWTNTKISAESAILHLAEAEPSNTHFLCNEAVLLVFVCGQVRGVCVTCNVLPTPNPGQLATLELAVIATLEYYQHS